MTALRRVLLFVAVLVAVILAYLLVGPVPIEPVAWTPPSAPTLTGEFQQNTRLATTERLPVEGNAPEDVALDKEGRVYAGLDDGRIVRVAADGTHPENFANTHGRPLGMAFDAMGNLIVADANKGLLAVSPNGSVTTLTTEAAGSTFHCTNDLAVAADGTIYFTDASARFPLANYKADILEHQTTGRLLAYEPATKSTRVVLKNLAFANGVAVGFDQTYVLVVETGKYRVHRVWISGPRQGESEIFIDNLPGFPDGITSNQRDKFWLALVTPRDATLDRLLPHPFLRKVVMRLPKFLQPAPKRFSFVLGLDAEGHVTDNLQDGSPGCFAQIANAVERDGKLYFGSIGERAIGRYSLR